MKSISKQQILQVLITLGILASLGGCVLPVPMPPKTQATYIAKDEIDFIKKGETTQAAVREQLGEPSQQFEDPTRWIYTLRSFMGNRWAVCVAIGAPGYGDADCGMASEGRLKFKVLELEFDKEGIVTDKDTSSIIEGKCERSDICDEDGQYVAYDRGAVDDDDIDEACDIYVFVENNEDFRGDQVLMDGVPVGYLEGTSKYLNFTAPIGQHDIRPSFESRQEKPHVVFDCRSNERVVVLMQASGPYENYLSREFVGSDELATILNSQLTIERIEYTGD